MCSIMSTKKSKRRPTCCFNPLDGLEKPTQYLLSLGPSFPLDSKHDALIRYKLQQAKNQTMMKQRSAKAHLDFITEELEKIKIEIRNVRMAIKEVGEPHDPVKDPKEIPGACKLRSTLRDDLTDLLHWESHLRRQLCLIRVAYRNAKLDDFVLDEDMRKYKDIMLNGVPLAMLHFQKKDDETRQRLRRETQAKRNAIMVREETITSVANSITDHVLQKIPGTHNETTKQIQEAKLARRSISTHIQNTFRKIKQMKALALTEIQIRQNRQLENLAKLRKDINEIKKTLTAKNQIRRMREEEIAVEKEEVKNLLQSQGANPYLAEYLLMIEEKQREVQRKMLVEEQKRLLEMRREYAIIEASKTKEETDRKKWDEHWAQKKKEKVARDKKEKYEKYFDVHDEEEGVSASGTTNKLHPKKSDVKGRISTAHRSSQHFKQKRQSSHSHRSKSSQHHSRRNSAEESLPEHEE